MNRFGIDAQPNPAFPAQPFQFVEDELRNHALSIISNDDTIGSGYAFGQDGQHTPRRVAADLSARLAIDANDLLLVRHNASLDAGVPAVILD
jgi:hypothetical protein